MGDGRVHGHRADVERDGDCQSGGLQQLSGVVPGGIIMEDDMQKFEPDQLVLVRGSEHTNWDLAHYSYCVVKEGKATFHHLQGWTLLFRVEG